MNSGSKFNHYLYTSAFAFLLIVAILGLLLRSAPLVDLPLPYPHILHAHSHTALLGWAFVMSITSILRIFKVPFNHIKTYGLLLIFSIIGMLVAFLYQSYGPISIGFSTIYMVIAYIILFKIYKQLPATIIGNLCRRSIIWFYISTLGIWCLGPTAVMFGKDFWLYDSSIQFFLHFQINGWLLYVALGVLISTLSDGNAKHNLSPILNSKVLYALDIGLILGLAPLVYWIIPYSFILILNAVSALCLFYGLGHIAWRVWLYQGNNHVLSKFISILLIVSIATHIITIIPGFVAALESNRNLIIAYLHLILLGIVSLSYVFYSLRTGIIPNNKISWLGILLWAIGFIVTESLLMLQGLFHLYLSNYLQILWLFSGLILIGILILFLQVLFHKKSCPNGQPL